MVLGPTPRPVQFTAVAVAVELSLVPLAGLVERLWAGSRAPLAWDLAGPLAGAAGAIPPLAVLVWLLSPRWREARFLRRIHGFLRDAAGPTLGALRWPHMALIGISAGIGEEVLFRGILQPRMGLAGASILFGLLHPFTPAYAAIAGLLGAYMGWLVDWAGNLLAPIVAHAVYDTVALALVGREMRGGFDRDCGA